MTEVIAWTFLVVILTFPLWFGGLVILFPNGVRTRD